MNSEVEQNEDCQRLVKLPGFGPMVTAMFKSWVGDGSQYRSGREAAAALGVIPRQHSSGGKPLLLGITKKGDKEVRTMIIHGARAAVKSAARKNDHLSQWINALVARRGFNKATVALGHKLIRIAWAIVRHQTTYGPLFYATREQMVLNVSNG